MTVVVVDVNPCWSRIPYVMRVCVVVCGFGCGGVGLVLVENCTVDASIFVVKLLRAYGGCLGTRSR